MGLLGWAKVGTKVRNYQIFDPKIGLGIPKASPQGSAEGLSRKDLELLGGLAVLAVQEAAQSVRDFEGRGQHGGLQVLVQGNRRNIGRSHGFDGPV